MRMPITRSPSFTTATLSSLKMSRSLRHRGVRPHHALERLHQRLHHLGEAVLPLDEEVEQVVLVDHADAAALGIHHRHLRDVVVLHLLHHHLDLVVLAAVMTSPRRLPSTSRTVDEASPSAPFATGKPLSRIHSSE